jgi:hypothetical protein
MKPFKPLLLLTLGVTMSIFVTGCETDGDDDEDHDHHHRASTTTTTTVEERRVVPGVTHETRVERY